MNDAKIKKMTTIAMLCAIAYVVMFAVRIPVVLFLKYEPKDVIIAIGGFMMGPMAAFTVSFVVALIEMFSVSDTGIIGFIMNVLSSCSFACVAALIYKYKKNIKGAVVGLIAGTAAMVSIMMLWNYLITPLYMNIPRSEVVKLLVPAILPFNVLKGLLNSTITFLIYKPIVRALRRTKLIDTAANNSKASLGFSILAGIILVTSVLAVLALKGII